MTKSLPLLICISLLAGLMYMQDVRTTALIGELEELSDIQSGEITALNDKISALDENIAALQSQNEDLIYLAAGLHEDLSDLYERVRLQDGRIDKLETALAELDGRFAVMEAVWEELNFGYFTATAYSPFDNVSGIENDGDPTSTATGTYPDWGTFAVCPDTIPYYSDMVVIGKDFIEHGQALDTGGTMRKYGTWIDLYRDHYWQTVEFGKQDVLVFWQESGGKK